MFWTCNALIILIYSFEGFVLLNMFVGVTILYKKVKFLFFMRHF